MIIFIIVKEEHLNFWILLPPSVTSYWFLPTYSVEKKVRIYKDIFVQKSWYISLVQKWEMKYLSCPKEIWRGIRLPGESVWANSIWKLDFRALGSTVGSVCEKLLVLLPCLLVWGGGRHNCHSGSTEDANFCDKLKVPKTSFHKYCRWQKAWALPNLKSIKTYFPSLTGEMTTIAMTCVWWLVVYKPCCGCFFTHSVVDVVQSKISFS